MKVESAEPIAPFGILELPENGWEVAVTCQELDTQLARRIHAQAESHRVGATTVFHAALGLVVARTADRADVLFGSVLTHTTDRPTREQPRPEEGWGILPVRLCLENTTAAALLEQTQRELEKPPRAEPSTPLFNTLLDYRNRPVRQAAAQERPRYPITLSVIDQGESITVTAQTDHRLNPQRIVQYLCRALQSLLEMLEQASPLAALSLSILPESERRQVLELFNATQASYPRQKLVHELFEEQVRRTPDAIAVIHEGHSLTYTELNAKANQLARYLQERGVEPDRLVGICVERSPEMLVGLFGTLKAGGAYVPLDPSYPPERFQYMLSDAAPTVVLTQAHLTKSLPQTNAEVIALDGNSEEIAQHPTDDLDPAALGLDSGHLAYVIYTSGSTGTPKGVMVEHAGLMNYLHWAMRTYAPERGDAIPVSSPLAFDATVTSLFAPLLSGRSAVLIPTGQELQGLECLLQQPRQWSLVKISPAHLQVLGQRLRPSKPPCTVGAFVIGGEALPPSTVELWRSIWPQTRLINEYGPTETVVGCCVYDIPPNWVTASSVPIGRPISNTRIYILDSGQQPVAIGVTGEIYIGGSGVARGYLNRPEQTARRFLKDPFCADPKARMYRTGDLGRWCADGNIEYLGRNDHQVKIRGFRIELGEIEAQLLLHPQVKKAAVLAREDEPGDKRLVAYVVGEMGSGWDRQQLVPQLRAYLKARLPEYMVPMVWMALDDIPLTLNGKIDRRALPDPRNRPLAQGYIAPATALERALVDIWAQTLRVDQPGVRDDFFELGGHSLHAMTLIARIAAELGIELTIVDVLKSPTIELLVKLMESERPSNTGLADNGELEYEEGVV